MPPPIVKSGASVPPEVPLPSATDHDTNFNAQNGEPARPDEIPPDDALDVVVADPQRMRREQPTTPTTTAAERRPPHPVDGEVLEEVLYPVDELRHLDARRQPTTRPDDT